MNTIREIQSLNKRELENNVSIGGSWHRDFDDTAYIYIGGLPFDLSEGDVIAIFSQYGEPVYVNLVRDKETGKSKGFAFLKYEDQRSTDLAVDNLGGAVILGRTLKVDHTRYKRKDNEEEEEARTAAAAGQATDVRGIDGKRAGTPDSETERPMLKEERELAALIRDHDEDDPMKGYLVQEKKEEVAQALAALRKKSRKHGERKERRHHKHSSHRSRRHSGSDSDHERRRRHRSQEKRSRNP